MKTGQRILGRRHVHPEVVCTLKQLQVEGTFVTGTHLVTVDDPISTDDGDIKLALYGTSLELPKSDLFPLAEKAAYSEDNMPGAVNPAKASDIILHPNRKRVQLKVVNRGSRAVYVS
jgi:urease